MQHKELVIRHRLRKGYATEADGSVEEDKTKDLPEPEEAVFTTAPSVRKCAERFCERRRVYS
jgi:hypothetical protein